ncbi:MAG: anhydro-N-acetylmuramic acid kinase [Candidatus Neomarinimicrobiota bacterium]
MTGRGQPLTVLGLMSGTSMDGVDACLARISLSVSTLEFQILDNVTIPFEAEERKAIAQSLTGTADEVAALHFRLGAAYARVAGNFLKGRAVDLVGCHGQTVAHRDGNYTLQVGTAAHLRSILDVPVVSNFREADVAAGGNGAPLMPFLDWLLCRSRPADTVILNVGGVANISAVARGAEQMEVIGFDTGPGMGLIDEAAGLMFGHFSDLDGRYSAEGAIREEILAELMAHPFVRRRPPKSTGRDEFGQELVEQLVGRFSVPPADLLRSLVRFTARSIVDNMRRFVSFYDAVDTLIVSGGGVHHPLLMADLEAELPAWKVVTSQVVGIDPDFKEAFLMAVLAVAHVQGMASNMPGVTGARELVVLGQITSR